MSKYIDFIPQNIIEEKWRQNKKTTPDFIKRLRQNVNKKTPRIITLDPVSKKLINIPLPDNIRVLNSKKRTAIKDQFAKLMVNLKKLREQVKDKKKVKPIIIRAKKDRPKKVGVQGRQKKYINKV
jgi:hypothetical protein